MSTGQSLIEEFQATWTAMKAALDDTKNDNRIAVRQMNARLDELETALRRPGLPGMRGYDPDVKPNADTKLFLKAVAVGGPQNLRDPDERVKADRLLRAIETKSTGPSESKALSLGDDAAGGFLAPSELANEIIKGVQVISPVRQFARTRPTSFRSVQVPVRSGVFAAQWVGETATREETTGLAYSMEDLPTYEMYAYVLASLQDIEDSAFDIAAEIASEAAEQFAVAEGAAFVSGNSVKKPEGFMTNAAIAHVPSGDAALLTGDGLINLMYSLKAAYAANAVWVMSRATAGKIRLMKNSTTGDYLWQPGLQAGDPSRLLGRSIYECDDMPAVSGGAFPVAFGDFRRGYLIADRLDISVQRLNEKFAEQGQVGFLIRKRVGGKVVLPESIKKQEIASS